MTDRKRQTLDYMVHERLSDIYFLLKEELDVPNNSPEERILYDACEEFKKKVEVVKQQVSYMHGITELAKKSKHE